MTMEPAGPQQADPMFFQPLFTSHYAKTSRRERQIAALRSDKTQHDTQRRSSCKS
jgi:hypothetical protein